MEKTNFLDALVTAELSLFGIADQEADAAAAAAPASASPAATKAEFTDADYRSAAG
ncbi:hypothetical protein [Bordetella genomosp. 13]|uniref:hypothetical protein n=1 Tax=Bordetella genomosp. 13 TaxID=463040 RepID=UPI0016428EE9|nr:hypothetical protein [Bordetella genomosp. 13]